LGFRLQVTQAFQRPLFGFLAGGLQGRGHVVGQGDVLRQRLQFPDHARVHLPDFAAVAVAEEGDEAFQDWLTSSILQPGSVDPEAAVAPLFVRQDGPDRAVLLQRVVQQGVAGGNEVLPEPVGHLPLPLILQVSGDNEQRPPEDSAGFEFLEHQSRHDGLAQPWIIRQEEADARPGEDVAIDGVHLMGQQVHLGDAYGVMRVKSVGEPHPKGLHEQQNGSRTASRPMASHQAGRRWTRWVNSSSVKTNRWAFRDGREMDC